MSTALTEATTTRRRSNAVARFTVSHRHDGQRERQPKGAPPETPLLPATADCVTVFDIDLTGGARDERMLVYLDHDVGYTEPARVALAVAADGSVGRVHLSRAVEFPYPWVRGVRDLNGDGGQDVVVALQRGTGGAFNMVFAWHDGGLHAVARADTDEPDTDDLVASTVFAESGAANLMAGMACPDDGTLVLRGWSADHRDDGLELWVRVFDWRTPSCASWSRRPLSTCPTSRIARRPRAWSKPTASCLSPNGG